MKQLPPDFINQIQTDLGSEAKLFFKSLEKISPTAIRYNPFKKMKSFFTKHTLTYPLTGWPFLRKIRQSVVTDY